MTEKQKKFAEYYAQCGNAVQSALKSGYSENYANGRCYELLGNVEVSEYIKTLSNVHKKNRILTAIERQEILSDIANSTENSANDRIKAIDTLNKMTGEYIVKQKIDVSTSNPFSELTTDELKKLINNG